MKAADTKQVEALKMQTPLDDADTERFFKTYLKNMESSNLADFFPFGGGGISHKSGIILGYDPSGSPVFFDNWHPKQNNQNIVIFGRSGSGKSYGLKLVVARGLLENIRTAIIDPEEEYLDLARYFGCPYLELGADSEDRINIFDIEEHYDSDKGANYVMLDETVKAAVAVIFKMVKTVDEEGKALTSEQKLLIQEKVYELYKERGITQDPESLYQKAEEIKKETGKRHFRRTKKIMPRLKDFYEKIANDKRMRETARIIKSFTEYGDSPNQAIFDCYSTVNIKDAPLFVFGMSKLDKDMMRPIANFIATKWVWETFGSDPSFQKRIVIDEAQEQMDKDNIETARWLENAFRKSRKRNTSMVAITQGFEVFMRLDEGWGILKNASTKLLFKQEAIDIDSVQGKFNLSEGESNFLLAPPTGAGILKCEDETSIVFITATPEEHKIFTTDPEELKQIREKQKQQPVQQQPEKDLPGGGEAVAGDN